MNNSYTTTKPLIVTATCLLLASLCHANEPASKSAKPESVTEPINVPFDRLFTSARERQILDHRRSDNSTAAFGKTLEFKPEANVNKSRYRAPKAPKAKSDIAFSGILLRSDGTQTLWVNGKVQHRKSHSDSLTLPLSPKPSSKTLKPGQRWKAADDQIVEPYGTPNVLRTDN